MTIRYASIKAAILIAVGILGLCLYFAACDRDNPVEPPQPKDYAVYFHDGGSDGVYFSYHPLTAKLETFTLPADAWQQMAVSADGELLYIPELTTVAVVDIQSRTVLTRLPYKVTGGVAVSPDNQYLAVLGEDLHILRTTDYSVVFHDTGAWMSEGRFSADSRSFYCASGGVTSSEVAYRVRLDSSFAVTRKAFPKGSVRYIVPSPDESKWYVYVLISCYAWFQVYDEILDSVIYCHPLPYGTGSLEMTRDGRYVFYTQPGNFNCFFGPETLWVYDANHGETVVGLETFVDTGNADTIWWPVGDMVVTPDGRWLVGGGVLNELGLVIVDLVRMAVDTTLYAGNKGVYYLCCQNSP